MKVSLVGHSQIPQQLEVAGTETRIFRAPGGRADSFYSDDRLRAVLEWKHDLCILWVGSNDIAEGMKPQELTQTIKDIIRNIERDCGAIVCLCLIEPRTRAGDRPISATNYKKVQQSVNSKLKRTLHNQVIHFNTAFYVETLNSGGVHWTSEGRERVDNKLVTVIKGHKEIFDS